MKTAVILSLVALAMCTGQTEANIRQKLHRALSSKKGCPSRWGRFGCRRYCGFTPNPNRGLKCQPGYHAEFSNCQCASVCVKDPPAHCRGFGFDEADEESVGGWERAIAYDENDNDEDVSFSTPRVVGWDELQFDEADEENVGGWGQADEEKFDKWGRANRLAMWHRPSYPMYHHAKFGGSKPSRDEVQFDEADEEKFGKWGRAKGFGRGDELQFDENDSDEFQLRNLDENVNDEEIGKRTRMRPKMRL